MTPTRRSFARCLALTPAALALPWPSALPAQQEDPFGGELPPNVFYSPCGRPFRAKPGAPYPIVDWFKQADANADGKIEHAEFVADAMAFFKVLDRNADGVISPQEVAFYEQRIAPEVLGMRVEGTSNHFIEDRPRLWLVQGIPGGLGPGGTGSFHPGGATGPGTSVDPGSVDAGPAESGRPRPYDASGKGASPYGFFDEPEPVTAADFNFRGLISKADFTKLADAHFTTLDRDGAGYLSLESLPKTPVQRRLERVHHARRG
ncbi:MAG: EF-hand domain protein [Caulobacteraceae bacterium]|nr:EF-hand domain protein [Caulobacteraceae bacterium]